MIHPLIHDLDKLKDEEIHSRINDLQQKYWSTTNAGLQFQISLVLEVYANEQQRRQAVLWEKINQKNKDKQLNKLINVT